MLPASVRLIRTVGKLPRLAGGAVLPNSFDRRLSRAAVSFAAASTAGMLLGASMISWSVAVTSASGPNRTAAGSELVGLTKLLMKLTSLPGPWAATWPLTITAPLSARAITLPFCAATRAVPVALAIAVLLTSELSVIVPLSELTRPATTSP